MIRLFGDLLLFSALLFAFLQSILPLWGYYRHNPYALAVARPTAIGQCVFVLTAFLLLISAFASDDFSIAYVAANSHPALPFIYKLTAVWGAHEGSILLWILILNIWSLTFILFGQRDTAFPIVLVILGIISFCFLSFLLLTSNPFLPAARFQIPLDLNPLLQDPGFVTHPPMLYMGYVGFSAAFAITQAALLTNKLDHQWARSTRYFALSAWCFLTLGITLGSWWAYRVLGWGGFWFWDPVENASLLPWLSGTALIHILLLTEKHQMATAWAALLAIITFALSILGTFLVRSGILVSAHTFASDPARGVFLLLLLGLLCAAALGIYFYRIVKLTPVPLKLNLCSREMGLLINSALLFVAMLIILLGTLYPLILDAFHLGTISVGAPYFNKVMLPFTLIVMALMGLVPFCRWQEQSTKLLWLACIKKIGLSIFVSTVLLLFFTHQINFLALISSSLSLWIILSTFTFLRLKTGMAIAHIGFAVLLIGLVLSSSFNQEREVRIKPGNALNIGPYQFFFLDMDRADGPNYIGVRAHFEVIKNKRFITHLYPEKRRYTIREMMMSKVDIHPSIFRDLYIALGEPLEQDYWSVRIYYKPFVRWIWAGGLMMMMGGFMATLARVRFLRSRS